MPNTVEELLEKLRGQLIARKQESEERVGRIKAAADEYLRAVEADLVAETAARVGIESARPSSAVRAALTLRSLVEALPEVRVRAEAPPVEAAPEPEAHADEARAPARRVETDPEVDALYREFQATEFDGLSDTLFKPWAEEFACRARGLQARGLADGADLLTRMFRVLTAKAFQRNTRDIFGLARNHHGDWVARAERARREREHSQAGPGPRTVSTRIVIPDALRAAVAAPEEDEAAGWPELPRLLAVCAERPLVLLGGVVKQEKLDRLKKHLGGEVEWIATDNGNPQGIASLERRVREGRVGAVVVLEELIGHRHFSPVVDAARQVLMPIAYGAKAGKASIERALQDLEAMLAREPAATGT
jgi:hypothetical protein